MDSQSSRDITNLSKKVIFLLHRVINTESASDDRTLSLHAAQEGRKKLGEVQLLFKAMRPELAGDRFWRYQHSVSPGLQEYIEALSFAYYIEHGTLITYSDVQRSLSDEEDGPVSICVLSAGAQHSSSTGPVLPAPSVRLPAGRVRPHRRAHALRYLLHLETRPGPFQGLRSEQLRARMQSR